MPFAHAKAAEFSLCPLPVTPEHDSLGQRQWPVCSKAAGSCVITRSCNIRGNEQPREDAPAPPAPAPPAWPSPVPCADALLPSAGKRKPAQGRIPSLLWGELKQARLTLLWLFSLRRGIPQSKTQSNAADRMLRHTPPTTDCKETFSFKWGRSRPLFWAQNPIFEVCIPPADSLGLAGCPCSSCLALRVSCRVKFGQTSVNQLFQIT